MKTSKIQTGHFTSHISHSVPCLAFAALLAAIAMTPALARDHDDDRGGRGNWNNGRGNGGHHGHRHGYQDDWNGYQPRYWQPTQPNAYRYAPPPVYYAPYPSPGINLVLPIHIN